MPARGKNYRKALENYNRATLYAPEEAIAFVKKNATAKFDETVEVHIYLGIDPKKSDQNVRGTVVLPHGTGKTPKIIVFAKGDKAKDAEDAGADIVGAEDLIEKIKGGWSEFDIAVASPDMMGAVGSNLGKILGPRMPNPKAGTVSPDLKKTVKELKSGKIQYRNDKLGIIHCIMGKASFEGENLKENLQALLDAIQRARPATAKGTFFKSIVLTSTMGPGVKVDPTKATLLAQGRAA